MPKRKEGETASSEQFEPPFSNAEIKTSANPMKAPFKILADETNLDGSYIPYDEANPDHQGKEFRVIQRGSYEKRKQKCRPENEKRQKQLPFIIILANETYPDGSYIPYEKTNPDHQGKLVREIKRTAFDRQRQRCYWKEHLKGFSSDKSRHRKKKTVPGASVIKNWNAITIPTLASTCTERKSQDEQNLGLCNKSLDEQADKDSRTEQTECISDKTVDLLEALASNTSNLHYSGLFDFFDSIQQDQTKDDDEKVVSLKLNL